MQIAVPCVVAVAATGSLARKWYWDNRISVVGVGENPDLAP